MKEEGLFSRLTLICTIITFPFISKKVFPTASSNYHDLVQTLLCQLLFQYKCLAETELATLDDIILLLCIMH